MGVAQIFSDASEQNVEHFARIDLDVSVLSDFEKERNQSHADQLPLVRLQSSAGHKCNLCKQYCDKY